MQSACIISAFRQQSDWRDIEKQAEATLDRQVTLAVMEAETEDTENVILFWTLFNEVLKKVSGDKGKMFNPQAGVQTWQAQT